MASLVENNTKTNLLGVWVSRESMQDVLARIEHEIHLNSKAVVGYANIHSLNLAFENPWLRDYYNQCAVVFCDGVAVKFAAKILGAALPHRLTLPDWIAQLAEQCATTDRTMFLLGGKDGAAQKAADKLMGQVPGLEIVGTHHGYFDKRKGGQANQTLVKHINRAAPDVLVVGFGIPLQERWILENKSDLQVRVFLAAGALFDYISGEMWRAPRWMTDNGFEWLGRLVREPRRLWRRYLIGIPVFFARVLKQKLGLPSITETKT